MTSPVFQWNSLKLIWRFVKRKIRSAELKHWKLSVRLSQLLLFFRFLCETLAAYRNTEPTIESNQSGAGDFICSNPAMSLAKLFAALCIAPPSSFKQLCARL